MHIIYISEKDKPKHSFWRVSYTVGTVLLKIILTIATMVLVASHFIPLAYKERGYYAIGGEWLLIIGFGLLVWFGLHYLLKEEVDL